jgi:hypothetical protein
MGLGATHSRLLQQPAIQLPPSSDSVTVEDMRVGRIKQCAIPKIVRTNDLYEDL